MTTDTLLPPNSTPLERALDAVGGRASVIPSPVETLLDPAAIAPSLLPWLAWALSVDGWNAGWSEVEKRDAVARSIALHRTKGTRASVEEVLARHDSLLALVEWHQQSPRGQPHTVEVRLPLAGDGVPAGGSRATATFAEAILRDIARVKPVREHVRLVQQLTARTRVGVQAAARTAGLARLPTAFTDDRSLPWEALLQTENGEPIEAGDGGYLETTA